MKRTMTKLTMTAVRRLERHRALPCMSLYLGLDSVWPGGPADRARMGSLLRKAARKLSRELDLDAVEPHAAAVGADTFSTAACFFKGLSP